MQGMMDGMMGGGMMWGMGLYWLLGLAELVLAAGALIKYLVLQRQGQIGSFLLRGLGKRP